MPDSSSEGVWISPTRCIPESELHVQRVRSGGPGGQNVNKTASKIVLRFHPGSSTAFSAEERARLAVTLAGRLTGDGELVLHASEHRSAERNLEAAHARLAQWLREGLARPKARRATRPSRSAGRRRLEAKRQRSERKRERRSDPFE